MHSPHIHRYHVLTARSGDAIFLETLRAHGFRGRVHSVFERVINLESDCGQLWTLAGRGFDNAPNTLIVDTPELAHFAIARGASCARLDHDELRIGASLRVAFGAASGWRESPLVYPIDVSALRTNLRQIEFALAKDGTAGGFLPASEFESASLRAANTLLKQQATRLVDALSHGDLVAAGESAIKLVGLGPGLTPSGDDYLTGLFAVLNIQGSPAYRFRGFCNAIVATAEADKLTNAISFSALKMAAEGRVRESIVTLLRDLMYGKASSLNASLSRVLAIGSTSGTDIVSGIVSGFKVILYTGRAR